jgi:REP-associated tyrosine transposase
MSQSYCGPAQPLHYAPPGMPRQPRCFAPGLIHHVLARGNRREAIFFSSADFLAYLARLRRYCIQWETGLLAYCLMPNHVHLLIRQGPISLDKFMQGVQQSYTLHFNRSYETTGHVFQGRYKALWCHEERYLATLVRYIHLNPVRAGLVTAPEAYPYSSHRAYLRGRTSQLVDPAPVLRILGGPAAYRAFLGAATEPGARDGEPEPPSAWAPGQSIPAARVPPTRNAGTVADELARKFQVDLERLRSPDRSWAVCRARSLVAYALVRRLGYPVTTAAQVLDRQAHAVSMMLSRLTRNGAAQECIDCEA